MNKRKILYICLALSLGQLCGCAEKDSDILSSGASIVCFGNSITEGVGSTQGNDYPSLLARRLNRTVINAGVRGDTTNDALNRIEQDVLRHNPGLVIVEFAGNDFLQGVAKQQTFDNLDKVVTLIQQQGALVVLVGVEAGYFRDEYIRGLEKIAQKRKTILISNVMEGIHATAAFRSDSLHPNDAGYRLITERIYTQIRPLLESGD